MSNIYIKNLNGINYTPNLSQINTTIKSTFTTPLLPIISSTMTQDQNNLSNYTITVVFTSTLSGSNRAILNNFFVSATPFANSNPQFATVATGICGSVVLLCNVNSNTLRVQLPAENGTTIATTTSVQQFSNKIINANCNSITNLPLNISGILPVVQGGTGLSSMLLNSILIGNNSSTPTMQTLDGEVLSEFASQFVRNKTIASVSNSVRADSIWNLTGTTFSAVDVVSLLPAPTGITSPPLNGSYLTASIPVLAAWTNNGSQNNNAAWLYSYQTNRLSFVTTGLCNTISNSGITTGQTLHFIQNGPGVLDTIDYNTSTGIYTCPVNGLYNINLIFGFQRVSPPGTDYPIEIGIYNITTNTFNIVERDVYYIPDSTEPINYVIISNYLTIRLNSNTQIIPYYSTFTVGTVFNIISTYSKCTFLLSQQFAT